MLYCNALRFAMKHSDAYFDGIAEAEDDSMGFDIDHYTNVAVKQPYPRPPLAQYSPYQMFAIKSLLNVTTPRIVMSQSNYRRGNPHAGPTIFNPDILTSSEIFTTNEAGEKRWESARDYAFVYAFQDPDDERAHLRKNSLIDSEFLTVLQEFAKETFCYSQQITFDGITTYISDGEHARTNNVVMKSILSNTEFHNLIHLDFKDLTYLNEEMIFDALSAPDCRWKRPQLLQSLDLRNTGIPSMPHLNLPLDLEESHGDESPSKEPVFLSSILNKFFPFLKKLRVDKRKSGVARYDLIHDLRNIPTLNQTLEEISIQVLVDTDCTSFVETVRRFKKLRKVMFSGEFADDLDGNSGMLSDEEKLQYPGGKTVFSKLGDCSLECIDFGDVSLVDGAGSIFINGIQDIVRFCESSLRVLNLSGVTVAEDRFEAEQIATAGVFFDTLFEFCPNLEILGVGTGFSTRMPVMVTDKFLREIPSNLTNLKLINLMAQAKVSDSAIAAMRKAMPELIVLSHDAVDDTDSDDFPELFD